MTNPAEGLTIEQALERRRAAVADAWQLDDQIVLIGAGDPIHRPGRDDTTYLFEAHDSGSASPAAWRSNQRVCSDLCSRCCGA